MKLIKRESKEIMLQKKEMLFYLPNQYIGIISEGSCDTEDWSNNAKNSALNTLHFIFKKITILWFYVYNNITVL